MTDPTQPRDDPVSLGDGVQLGVDDVEVDVRRREGAADVDEEDVDEVAVDGAVEDGAGLVVDGPVLADELPAVDDADDEAAVLTPTTARSRRRRRAPTGADPPTVSTSFGPPAPHSRERKEAKPVLDREEIARSTTRLPSSARVTSRSTVLVVLSVDAESSTEPRRGAFAKVVEPSDQLEFATSSA